MKQRQDGNNGAVYTIMGPMPTTVYAGVYTDIITKTFTTHW